MLEPQEFRENRRCCDLTSAVELCIAVSPDPVIKLALLLIHCDVPGLKGLLRQIDSFFLCDPEGDAVFFLDQSIQILVSDDLFFIETAHDGVSVPELIKVCTEDLRIQKAVLTEDVDRIVLDRRSGKYQLIPCLVSEFMYCLTLRCIVSFYPLALIADDHVRIVLFQLFKDSGTPGALIIDHGHLQCFEWKLHQIVELLDPLALLPQERPAGIFKVREFLKLFRPHRND